MTADFIGVLCGLKSEAKTVRAACADPAIRIGVSGADAARAEAIAAQFCDAGARAILSVGVSGGLDPALVPGDFLIGRTILTGAGARFDCDAALTAAILAKGGANAAGGAHPAALFGADEIIASRQEKARLFRETGAAGVDMESHGAARAAAAAQIPFAAVRAIADPADRALPPAALGAVAPDGSTRVLTTLMSAARAPGQVAALVRLGADSAKALAALRARLPSVFDSIGDSMGIGDSIGMTDAE